MARFEHTVSKTVRIPVSLVAYIDSLPGDNFSERLINLIDDSLFHSLPSAVQKEALDYEEMIIDAEVLSQMKGGVTDGIDSL